MNAAFSHLILYHLFFVLAFHAPVFLFLLYLAVKVVVGKTLGVTGHFGCLFSVILVQLAC